MNDGRERPILLVGDLVQATQFPFGHERDHPLGARCFRYRIGSSSFCTHRSPKLGSLVGINYFREVFAGNYR
jgi:hypothetical protein